jgi:glycosyltransferase involved in cell wall biosynthesis
MIRVGTEITVHETKASCTGIERVVRECHGDLNALLWAEGRDLVPFRIQPGPRSRNFLNNDYLASDPVLKKRLADIDDLDVMLFLDLHHGRDFSRLYEIRKQRKVPTVFLMHDLLPLLSPHWFPQHHDRIFRIYLQQVLGIADQIVTTSEKVAHDITSLGWRTSAEIHSMRLGSTFSPLPPPDVDHLALLYVSTIEPRKGHDVLLDAFDLLLENGVDVELTLVGRQGWECAETVTRITRHPALGTRLRWHQGVSDHEIRTISRNCNVAVMPSRDEGFGLFIEEALSLGLKVVASDIPVFRERSGPNVTFCDLTPDSLARAVCDAYMQDFVPVEVRSMKDFSLDLLDMLTTLTLGARTT